MIRCSTVVATAAALSLLMTGGTTAFLPSSGVRTDSALRAATQRQQPCNRREALFGVAGAALIGVWAGNPAPAAAKYSDYSRREKDWEERQKGGAVKYSTARDLRKQLAEIVPENNEGSKVFCPNGPSAAVSPLMENKCSDVRMAIPSVYGRSSDVVGNSIPGFQSGYSWAPGDSSSITSSVGGFPAYYSK
jgi:hypothetical protein